VIRYLQAKLKRKFEVTTNIGEEQNAGVRAGTLTLYPDIVLSSGRKIAALIEVETNESVNHLEALSQWAHFGRSRIPFHLYVPAGSVEMARRLAEESQATLAEIWSFHAIGEQIRFTMVYRSPALAEKAERPAETRRKPTAAARPEKKRAAVRAGATRTARPASRRGAARPSARKSASRAQKRK
jgi:hypothetical protein